VRQQAAREMDAGAAVQAAAAVKAAREKVVREKAADITPGSTPNPDALNRT
jgi:hypothetical protein